LELDVHPKAMPVILTTDKERDLDARAVGRGEHCSGRCPTTRSGSSCAAPKEDKAVACAMEYREKQYRVILGIDSQWKWFVDAIESYTKSSKTPSHTAGGIGSSWG
jgi:hypothetical protein